MGKTDSKQVLSTDHIESNLRTASDETITQPLQSLKSEHDDYWAEHPQEQQNKAQAQPANYWDEQVHHDVSESDNYWSWNSEESEGTTSVIRKNAVSQTAQAQPANYWDEQVD